MPPSLHLNLHLKHCAKKRSNSILALCFYLGAAAGIQSRADTNTVRWIDIPHDYISAGILIVSDGFDGFFDSGGHEEYGNTRVKITLGTELREGEDIRLKSRFGARLDLPHLKRRWNILLEYVDRHDDAMIEEEDEDFSATLRYLLNKTPLGLAHLDGGLRFSGRPVVYGRLRLRRQRTWDPHLARITQYVHWRSNTGFGATINLDYEQRVASDWLFRSRSRADWGEKTEGVEWLQQLTLANIQRSKAGLEGFIAADGVTRPAFDPRRYQAGIRFRYRLYNNWLYLDLTPGMEFHSKSGFRADPILKIAIETVFGRLHQ